MTSCILSDVQISKIRCYQQLNSLIKSLLRKGNTFIFILFVEPDRKIVYFEMTRATSGIPESAEALTDVLMFYHPDP